MSESILRLLRDAHRASKQGPTTRALRRERLAELVAYARAHSPYYRELYRDLPDRIADPTLLPVTTKRELMDRFDDWSTDREVTREKVEAFVEDSARIGERFAGKYLVATTSGTTGTRGIFILDDRYWAVASAMMLFILTRWLTPVDFARIIARGARFGQLIATDGHYLSFAANRRTQRARRAGGGRLRVFSVHEPVPELVGKLNAFDPALLWGYASVVALLAGEREAGRLRIKPLLAILAAEGLADGEYDRVARAFGGKIRNLYGGTEAGYAAYGCAQVWLHALGDWAILEPVDADYRPTPPGIQSHTVLLSNLANRVQPILRYDLGDSILQRPDPCPCGDRSPAIRVEGRAADVLAFPGKDSTPVRIAPLVFGSLVDRAPGVEAYQIVQVAPTRLRLRLQARSGSDPDRAWQATQAELGRLLAAHDLDHVAIERADEPPERNPGGKLRTVVPGSW
jgi:phenylacetate-CoA ligase